jgi:hypothetical protein
MVQRSISLMRTRTALSRTYPWCWTAAEAARTSVTYRLYNCNKSWWQKWSGVRRQLRPFVAIARQAVPDKDSRTVAAVENVTARDGSSLNSLQQKSLRWLRESTSSSQDSWSAQEIAMARHLLECWLRKRTGMDITRSFTSNSSSSNVKVDADSDISILPPRFATLILKQWLRHHRPNDGPLLLEYLYRTLHQWQKHQQNMRKLQNNSCVPPLQAFMLLQHFVSYSERCHSNSSRPGPRAYAMVFDIFAHASPPLHSGRNSSSSITFDTEQIPIGDHGEATVQSLTIMSDQLVAPLLALRTNTADSTSATSPMSSSLNDEEWLVACNAYLWFLARHEPNPARVEGWFRHYLAHMANAQSYAAVQHSWANHDADRALLLWKEMIQRGIQANLVCLNICLRALANAGRSQEAESLLWQMRQGSTAHETVPSLLRPDAYSYLAVIRAWTKSHKAERALAVAEHLWHDTTVPMSSTVQASILNAAALRPNSGPMVETLLSQMEQWYQEGRLAAPPCRVAYTIAIRAWGATQDLTAPDRATALVRRMELLGNTTTTRTAQSRPDLVPCTITYTTLMYAWAQSSRNDAPNRALAIWNHMEQQNHRRRDDGNPSIALDTTALNAVLYALSRHSRVDQALELLEKYKRHANTVWSSSPLAPRPDVISWATVIHAIGQRRDANSGPRATALLHDLEHLYNQTRDPSLQPTTALYGAVIAAHSSQDALAAEALFWRLVEDYEACPSNATASLNCSRHTWPIAPTTEICNAVLRVWSHSKDPVAPQRAESILDWMECAAKSDHTVKVRPNRDTFQYVLQAWVHSKRRNTSTHVQRLESRMALLYPH